MALKPLNERKEELIRQLQKNKQSNENYSDGIKIGINKSFQSFSDLIKQYLNYQNDVKKLMSEEQEIWKKWVQFYEKQQEIAKSDYIEIYNTWLFNYLFCNSMKKQELFSSLY